MSTILKPFGGAKRDRSGDGSSAEDSAYIDDGEWQSIFSAGKIGAWTLDLLKGELVCSKHCKLNFGRDVSQPFTYKELIDAVYPDDKARMSAAVIHSISSGEDYDIEYRAMTPSGEIRWVQVRGRPSYGKDGTPLKMTGISIDTTSRRQAELASEESTLRYRTLLEAIDEGVCIIEFLDSATQPLCDCTCLEANAAFTRHTGITVGAGRSIRELLANAEQWMGSFRSVLLSGIEERFERRATTSGRLLQCRVLRIDPAIRRQLVLLLRPGVAAA